MKYKKLLIILGLLSAGIYMIFFKTDIYKNQVDKFFKTSIDERVIEKTSIDVSNNKYEEIKAAYRIANLIRDHKAFSREVKILQNYFINDVSQNINIKYLIEYNNLLIKSKNQHMINNFLDKFIKIEKKDKYAGEEFELARNSIDNIFEILLEDKIEK